MGHRGKMAKNESESSQHYRWREDEPKNTRKITKKQGLPELRRSSAGDRRSSKHTGESLESSRRTIDDENHLRSTRSKTKQNYPEVRSNTRIRVKARRRCSKYFETLENRRANGRTSINGDTSELQLELVRIAS